MSFCFFIVAGTLISFQFIQNILKTIPNEIILSDENVIRIKNTQTVNTCTIDIVYMYYIEKSDIKTWSILQSKSVNKTD